MNKQQLANTLLRVVLGIIFVAHGIAKFKMGLGNVAGWFGSIGLPGFLAYFVAYLELFGGIALIIGFATRYVSFALAGMLLGAILTVKLRIGLLGTVQMAGYELDLALMVLAVYLVLTGAGAVAVDRFLVKNHE